MFIFLLPNLAHSKVIDPEHTSVSLNDLNVHDNEAEVAWENDTTMNVMQMSEYDRAMKN